MLSSVRRRHLRRALLPALVLLSAAGCERFIAEPAAGLDTTLALALAPTSPSFAIAPDNANRVRVQVLTEGGILFDQEYPFDPALEELLVPVRFTRSEEYVAVLVEISDGSRPLLRGSTEAQLIQRRVVDAEVNMQQAYILPLDEVRGLTAGIYHSCSLSSNSMMSCWGVNDEGQLGDGTSRPAEIAIPEYEPFGFHEVSAGLVNTCALGGEGEVYCWGSNRFGGLGVDPSEPGSTEPIGISSSNYFQQISVGGLHACGLATTGEVFCWGYNRWGQLGDGSTTTRFTPVPVASQFRFSSISAGYAHTCGVVIEVGTYCWGLNDFGQLGDGSRADRSVPTRVGGDIYLADVSAGGLHTCGIDPEGAAFCWGLNRMGQLGNGEGQDADLPQYIGNGYSSIVAGGLHTCALDQGSEAWCWGFNRSGAVGDGSSANRAAPTRVSGSSRFSELAAGLHHTCGTSVDRSILCWGYNRFGQVGDGTTENRLTPEGVLAGDRFFYQHQQEGRLEFAGLLSSMADGTVVP